MSKKATARQLEDVQAKAIVKNIRVSPRKLNLVAQMIRGKSAAVALNDLTFSNRRIAKTVKTALQSAVSNAENNHQLDVDRLYVEHAYVGKSFVMKRFHARARGRASRVEKAFSNLTLVVREMPLGQVEK